MTSVLWGNGRPFLDGDKVRELLHYKAKPRDETVEWLADALGVTPNQIRIEAKDATKEQKQAYETYRQKVKSWGGRA